MQDGRDYKCDRQHGTETLGLSAKVSQEKK